MARTAIATWRRLLTVFLALMLLTIASLGAVVYFQPALLRAPTEAVLSAALGRRLQVQGEFLLQPSLTPRLIATRVALANPPWASGPELARVERIELELDLASLFHGRVQMPLLRIQGGKLALEQDLDGRENWDLGSDEGADAGATGFSVPRIDRLELSGLLLTLDEPGRTPHRVEVATATANVGPDVGIQVQLEGTVDGLPLSGHWHTDLEALTMAGPAPMEVDVKIRDIRLKYTGSLGWPLRKGETSVRFHLAGDRFAALGQLLGQDWPALGSYRASGEVQVKAGLVSLSGLDGQVGKSQLQGQVSWAFGDDRPLLRLALQVDRLPAAVLDSVGKGGAARAGARQTTASGDAWPQRLRRFDADADLAIGRLHWRGKAFSDVRVTGRLRKGKLDLRLKPLAALSRRLEARLDLDTKGKAPVYRVRGSAERLHLGDLLRFAAIEIPVQGKLRSLHFDLRGEVAAGQWLQQVRGLDLKATGAELRVTTAGARPLVASLPALSASIDPRTRRLKAETKGTIGGHELQVRLTTGSLVQLGKRAQPQPLSAEIVEGASRLRVEGQFSYQPEKLDYRAQVTIEAPDLKEVGRLLARPLPPLGPVRFNARIAGSRQDAQLTGVRLEVGKSRIGGEAGVDLTRKPWRLRAKLSADLLQEGQLMAWWRQETAPAREPAKAQEGKVIPDIPIDTAWLKDRDLDLTLEVLHYMAGTEDLGSRRLTARIVDDRLVLDYRQVRSTYFSDLRLHSRVDATAARPEVQLRIEAEGVDMGGLLKAFEVSDRVTGKLDLSLQFQGRGERLPELLAAGTGTLQIEGGRGRIPYGLLRLWGGGLVQQLLLPRRWKSGDESRLRCLAARLTLQPGMLKSDGLVVATDLTTIAGSLQVDLPAETLSAVFQPKPKDPSLFSIDTPVQATGTLADAKIQPLNTDTLWTAGKLVLGSTNPATLILLFGSLGQGDTNPCETVLAKGGKGLGKGAVESLEEGIKKPAKGLFGIFGK